MERTAAGLPHRSSPQGNVLAHVFPFGEHEAGEINSKLRINESVLRCLTLKVEPRLVEALVAHASGVERARPAPAQALPVAAGVGEEIPDLEN